MIQTKKRKHPKIKKQHKKAGVWGEAPKIKNKTLQLNLLPGLDII